MANTVKRIISLQEAQKDHFNLDTTEITVWSAPHGHELDASNICRVENLVGRPYFDVVVNFGDYFKKRMYGSIIPEKQRWTKNNHPQGIEISEYNDKSGKSVAAQTEIIRDLVNKNGIRGWLDPQACLEYFEADEKIADFQIRKEDRKKTPVAIVRAGMPALFSAGYRYEQQLKIEAKRLNHKDDPSLLLVGYRFNEPVEDLDEACIVIRERAIATGASLIGLDYSLSAKKITPREVVYISTICSQQGAELLLKHMQLMNSKYGIKNHLRVGRLEVILTGGEHPFYIRHFNQNASEKDKKDANSSVHGMASGDGGDWADLFLPPGYRRVWPDVVSWEHFYGLRALDPRLALHVDIGQRLTFELALMLRNQSVKLGFSPTAVGSIFTGLSED